VRKPTKWELELSDDRKNEVTRIYNSKLILKALENEIDLLLRRGAGFKNISEALADHGIEIHRTTVAQHLKKLFPQYVIDNKFMPSEALLRDGAYLETEHQSRLNKKSKNKDVIQDSGVAGKKPEKLLDIEAFEEANTHKWKLNHERDKGKK
jgi:DNA-binding transcriptional ArsR family regulator